MNRKALTGRLPEAKLSGIDSDRMSLREQQRSFEAVLKSPIEQVEVSDMMEDAVH